MLWVLAGDARAERLREPLEAERDAVLISAVSVWEIAIKTALGKLKAPEDLLERLDAFAFERLPITDHHAWRVRRLPLVHHDPFDRLLAAQALEERAVLVSADQVFDDYGVVRRW